MKYFQIVEGMDTGLEVGLDNEFIQLLQEKYQVKIGTAVSKKTFAVIGKTLPTDGEKVKKAKECNVPIMTMAEFRGKFC